jgi:hypothetical protein
MIQDLSNLRKGGLDPTTNVHPSIKRAADYITMQRRIEQALRSPEVGAIVRSALVRKQQQTNKPALYRQRRDVSPTLLARMQADAAALQRKTDQVMAQARREIAAGYR